MIYDSRSTKINFNLFYASDKFLNLFEYNEIHINSIHSKIHQQYTFSIHSKIHHTFKNISIKLD